MDLKVLVSQLVGLFEKLNKSQKIIVGATIVGVVAFLLFLVVYTSKTSSRGDYKVLFDSLSAADASLVIQQLEKDNIPYRIPRDNVIEVPKDVVYKERISIAALGLPRESSVGFELFDSQEFGATSFDQNVKFLRALEGELSRTVQSLSPVEIANVNLALPKESLFVSKQVSPTASIVVSLYEGRMLSSKQIRGIKNLVSAAVPRMKPENVALINAEGEELGGDGDTSVLNEMSAMQMKYKNKEERKREQKIINVLSPFIGGDERVVAKVTIEYDFSQRSSTSEVYDPESVVRSEQTIEEKREGSSPKEIGGVPGAVSNIGPVQGLESQSSGEKYEKSNVSTNYEISKTVSSTKGEFATIKRVTAAVVVDGKYKNKIDEDGNPTDELEYIDRGESDLEAISSLVEQAIGINIQRGDLVTVRNFQFEVLKVPREQMSSKINGFVSVYLSPFSEIFKLLLVGVILFIVYKKLITPFAERMLEFSKEEDEMERPVLELAEEEEDDLIERVQKMRKKVEDQLGVGENFNEEELKYDVLLEKVRSLAEEKPEELASLVQALLDEELGGPDPMSDLARKMSEATEKG
ncbi:MAG: flagellar M-ring protein FliF [Arcobacter sp.]|nr:MAG: flagellar M-ring protein FliF [Arcobacter sp.]